MNSLNKAKIKDSENREKTLLQGYLTFQLLYKNHGRILLLLGLGCDKTELEKFILKYEKIYYIENPIFLKYLEDNYPDIMQLKQKFIQINFEQLSLIEKSWDIFLYSQNLLLFEDFWSSVLGFIRCFFYQEYHKINEEKKAKPAVLIGLRKTDLLAKELEQAYNYLGYSTLFIHDLTSMEEKLELFSNFNIQLFLSVNGQGLFSEYFHILKQFNIPTVLWFVDNPFHILSKYKSSWWKNIPLALSDASFIPALKAEGALCVFYLPLACHNEFKVLETKPVKEVFFAGSFEFKDHASFFASVKLNEEEQALCLQENAKHYLDYWKMYKPLFLNKKLKEIGYKALISTQYTRQNTLEAIKDFGLVLMGDSKWNRNCEFNLVSPEDYYSLSSWYSQSPVSLSLASQLMPSALNQRHFDVWQSQGFLISTHNSDSLLPDPYNIFTQIPKLHIKHPDYVVHSKKELLIAMEFYLNHPDLRQEISFLWQKELKNHNYEHRIVNLLAKINIKFP